MTRLITLKENTLVSIFLGSIMFLLIYYNDSFDRANDSIFLFYLLFAVCITLVITLLIREVLLFQRIKKLKGRLVIGNTYNLIFLIRTIAVIAYLAILLYGRIFGYEVLIFLFGMIICSLLPKPISESIYETDDGIICKGILFEYNRIASVKQNNTGGVMFGFGEKEKEIKYFSTMKNDKLFELLKSKVSIV